MEMGTSPGGAAEDGWQAGACMWEIRGQQNDIPSKHGYRKGRTQGQGVLKAYDLIPWQAA